MDRVRKLISAEDFEQGMWVVYISLASMLMAAGILLPGH